MFPKQPIPLRAIVFVSVLSMALALSPVSLRGQDLSGAPGSPAATEPATPLSAPSPQAVGPEEVVMSIGETKVTAAEFEKILSYLPPQFRSMAATLGKREFADQYGNLLGLALEGGKRKIDQSEPFRQMLSFQRLTLLAQITLNDLLSSTGAIPPQEIQDYYSSHQSEFEQVKLRGIYVPFDPQGSSEEQTSEKSPAESEPGKSGPGISALTEPQARAKAEALRSRIQAGEDMAALAGTESDHPTSSNGGDFGYVRRNQFTSQIEEIVFALPLNQVSAPVRDRFGYLLFRVEEKRAQSLAEARMLIENSLRDQKLSEVLAKVRNDYPINLNPRYFSESSPPAPTRPSK